MINGLAEPVPLSLPPSPLPDFNTTYLSSGTGLVRVHGSGLGGNSFNPCMGGQSRFGPLSLPDGSCLPGLYAGASIDCAIFESIFHDIAHNAEDKFVPLGHVTSRAISWMTTTVDLKLAVLHEPDLNLLGLTRSDLIDTLPSVYGVTARWAEAFHGADPSLQGLVWTSRRCDPERAYVFFGDRVDAGTLDLTKTVFVSSSAVHLSLIRNLGKRAGITLTV
jgi:hypothetical protein